MTNAELAILSLVAERPRHGYEIEQTIEARGMREWTEVGFSSIYYLLKKLQAAGLVEGHLEEGGRGPARRIYGATPAGHAAQQAAVLGALSQPQRCYPPIQLGLACLPAVEPSQARTALDQYRASLAARLAHTRERWLAQRPLPYFVEAMFEHSVSMLEAEIHWVEGVVDHLAADHRQEPQNEGEPDVTTSTARIPAQPDAPLRHRLDA
jgi:DNA-binding PadR family transcriptional regulator